MKQKTQKKELRWLWAHSRPAAGGILLLTLLYCVIAANSVVYALLMKQLVDSAIQHEMPGFFRAGALYLALILVQAALTMASNLTEEKLRAKLERGLRGSVFQTLLGMEHRTFSAYPAGTLLNHIATDVDTIVNEMLALLPGLLSLLVQLCAIAALLIAWDGRFALVLLAGGCVLLLAAPLLRRRMKRLQRAVREENDSLWAFLDEMFRSVPILKAFCAQKRMEEQLEDRLRRLQQVRYRQVVFSNVCNRGFNLAVNSGYLFGLIWCSIGLMQGTMTYGTLTAVLQLVAQLQVPFSQLSGYLPRYYAMCTAADRLMQLEQAPAEPRAAAEAPVDCAALYEELAAIRAEDLHFAYEQKPVYSGASLCIQKGETVAFMGSSGIGKSTFLKLLLALYQPTSGSIWLEGRDGTHTPVTVDTRPLFAYVPQQNTLLSGSIWESVALFRHSGELTDAEKRRVQQVCRTACAEEFITALPQGYDTVLGEGGKGISEGQMQRLAVARALYADCPILLLDEATSALDEATEVRLLANLQQDTRGKTILFVTHRRAALSLCSRVFEVEDGKLCARPVGKETE